MRAGQFSDVAQRAFLQGPLAQLVPSGASLTEFLVSQSSCDVFGFAFAEHPVAWAFCLQVMAQSTI